MIKIHFIASDFFSCPENLFPIHCFESQESKWSPRFDVLELKDSCPPPPLLEWEKVTWRMPVAHTQYIHMYLGFLGGQTSGRLGSPTHFFYFSHFLYLIASLQTGVQGLSHNAKASPCQGFQTDPKVFAHFQDIFGDIPFTKRKKCPSIWLNFSKMIYFWRFLYLALWETFTAQCFLLNLWIFLKIHSNK